MTSKKCNMILATAILLTFIMGTVCISSSYALAQITPPDAPGGGDVIATPTPSPPSGGGSSPAYSQPTFQQYVIDVTTSNGTVIGNVTGKSFFSAVMLVQKSDEIENETFTLTINAELGGKPDGLKYNIDFKPAGFEGLPLGMCSTDVLGMVSIERFCNYGWSLNQETLKFTFDIPAINESTPEDVYYLVRYDGTNYQVNTAKLIDGTDINMSRIEVSPPSDIGLFTLVRSAPVEAEPAATPTPMPTVTPTPTPEPTPEPSDGIGNIAMFAAMFATGALAGAAILFIITRK
ncbi:hypothetical protein CUJ83_10635 [Methanocella sp. CWC-04]|uniref:PGF-pre-PGF domain-containing protein n=1 Tax=Methanooceanicella nereidis TaxID=2052831 RepID=A0AAP2W5F9_9EURY|nr:hypothetical protein [Methanocella sp. CWC-04]MCD1295455.1 hypothetical protein [Methanocella sp. CWC-04]